MLFFAYVVDRFVELPCVVSGKAFLCLRDYFFSVFFSVALSSVHRSLFWCVASTSILIVSSTVYDLEEDGKSNVPKFTKENQLFRRSRDRPASNIKYEQTCTPYGKSF